jgi:hypothetical protein
MIAYLVYVGGFLAMAVALLVAIHLAVTAEERRYTAALPVTPTELKTPRAAPLDKRAA